MAEDNTEKDDYYFPHFMGARNDTKILSLRMKYGASGYGNYFMLVEIMRSNKNYELLLDKLPEYAYDIRCEENVLNDIITGFDLFEIDGNTFSAPRLNKSMIKRKELREKRIEAGKRGGLAKAKQNPSNAIDLVEQNPSKPLAGKERKGKEKKEEYSEDSDELQLAFLLFSLLKERDDKLVLTLPQQQSWAHEMNKIIRIDRRSRDEIQAVIYFSQQDDFWQDNIRSPAKLRKQFSVLLAKTTKAANTNNNNYVQDPTKPEPEISQALIDARHPDDPHWKDRDPTGDPVQEIAISKDNQVFIRYRDDWFFGTTKLTWIPFDHYDKDGEDFQEEYRAISDAHIKRCS